MTIHYKSPVVVIVEGDTEYSAYPGLLSKIIDTPGQFIPISNAKGYTNIWDSKRLYELILRACVYQPMHIVVTMDGHDPIKSGSAENITGVEIEMDASILSIQGKMAVDARFSHQPVEIVYVSQIKNFEAWLISDLNGLDEDGHLVIGYEAVSDPESIGATQWLSRNLSSKSGYVKPTTAAKLVGSLCPAKMEVNCVSFGKFKRAIELAYTNWRGHHGYC